MGSTLDTAQTQGCMEPAFRMVQFFAPRHYPGNASPKPVCDRVLLPSLLGVQGVSQEYRQAYSKYLAGSPGSRQAGSPPPSISSVRVAPAGRDCVRLCSGKSRQQLGMGLQASACP
jgi:hypothetical protein